jgi:hypothetical protein
LGICCLDENCGRTVQVENQLMSPTR